MTNDNNTIDMQVSAPDVEAIADDAQAAALLNAPVLAARPGPITFTTLGNLWGPMAAAIFTQKLEDASADPQNANRALASFAARVLGGSGMDPANAEAQQAAGALVAAGFCSQDAASQVLQTSTLRCGRTVTAAEVTASRQRISARAAAAAGQATIDAGRLRAIGLWDAYVSAIESGQAATSPTDAQIQAALAG